MNDRRSAELATDRYVAVYQSRNNQSLSLPHLALSW